MEIQQSFSNIYPIGLDHFIFKDKNTRDFAVGKNAGEIYSDSYGRQYVKDKRGIVRRIRP